MIKINPKNVVYNRIEYNNEEEFRKLYEWFSITDPSLEWTPRVRAGLSDGKKKFVNLKGEFYFGLKDKVIQFLSSENIPFEDNTVNIFKAIPDEDWSKFLDLIDLPFTPYDYQLRGAKLALDKKRHILLSATGCLDENEMIECLIED